MSTKPLPLVQFLTRAQEPSFWQTQTALCFVGTEYPLTFLNALFGKLAEQQLLPAPYHRLFAGDKDKQPIYASLSQSMLGMTSFYWLGNITEERESKAATAFKQFIGSYQGPHSIAYFIEHQAKPASVNATVIELPAQLDFAQFTHLAAFFSPQVDEKKIALAQTLFTRSKHSIDESYLLLQYLELVNLRLKDAYAGYLGMLFDSQASLNDLSEAFFARQKSIFFSHWSALTNSYPDVFWTVFWSENIWRAYHVMGFLQDKNYVQAKRMSFRLPYSFINRHWQSANRKELASAYEFLYQIDFAIKTGSSFCSLDVFFAHYFAGTFAREDKA